MFSKSERYFYDDVTIKEPGANGEMRNRVYNSFGLTSVILQDKVLSSDEPGTIGFFDICWAG